MVDIVDKALRMGEGHQLKKLENVAKAVNALEDEISALSDEDLKAQTPKFKQEIENGKSLDEIMPEAFATVREVSKRTLGQRHFDVQLMGGAALHWGNIAEMKTGEGKTLVATLPTYLNALEGKGVHVVTVNDYLASYQSELMGRIYRFLGMNKVLQAAGRVIRTPEDRGVVLLIDDRFLAPDTRRLMPPHWEQLRVVESAETLAGELERFWGREASPEGEAVSGPAR